MLLSDPESEIKAYVARSNIKNHARLAEVIQDFKATELRSHLFKLKTIWVPDGFDADSEYERAAMYEFLRSSIVDDILFNVVFGRLTATDVAVFLGAPGIVGLTLALLVYISRSECGIGNVAMPKQALGVSAGPIRERLLVLQAAGFVGAPNGQPGYTLINQVTPKGRVFLDLVRSIVQEVRSGGPPSDELVYVLQKLDCPLPPEGMSVEEEQSLATRPRLLILLDQVARVESYWGFRIGDAAG